MSGLPWNGFWLGPKRLPHNGGVGGGEGGH